MKWPRRVIVFWDGGLHLWRIIQNTSRVAFDDERVYQLVPVKKKRKRK